MAIGGQADRLVLLRKNVPAKDVVNAMREAGHKITLGQFYLLQNGQWPSQDQVAMICSFFGVTPEYWLFGVDDGLLDKIAEDDKKIIISLIEKLIKKDKQISAQSSDVEFLISSAEDIISLLSEGGGEKS